LDLRCELRSFGKSVEWRALKDCGELTNRRTFDTTAKPDRRGGVGTVKRGNIDRKRRRKD